MCPISWGQYRALPLKINLKLTIPTIVEGSSKDLQDWEPLEEAYTPRIVLTSNDDRLKDIKVSIGRPSPAFIILETLNARRLTHKYDLFKKEEIKSYANGLFHIDTSEYISLVLFIEGVSVSSENDVNNILQKVKDAISFELDINFNIKQPLEFLEERLDEGYLPQKRRKINFTFPEYQYDQKPMSLYWNAVGAEQMPLLQYFSYYQVLEYYFPYFARHEAHNIIKNMVKNPSFETALDENISNLLTTIQPFLSKGGVGNERSALLATVKSCVTEPEIRSFFEENHEIAEFFRSKFQLIASQKISVESSKADIVTETSNRIYEIRCKIVHTKSGDLRSQSALLLPNTKEAKQLGIDIQLIRFVAGKVLIAMRQPLQL